MQQEIERFYSDLCKSDNPAPSENMQIPFCKFLMHHNNYLRLMLKSALDSHLFSGFTHSIKTYQAMSLRMAFLLHLSKLNLE